MSHDTMLSKYGDCYNKVGRNSRYFVSVFDKTIIPFALVGYQMIIANSALRASLRLVGYLPSHIQRALVE